MGNFIILLLSMVFGSAEPMAYVNLTANGPPSDPVRTFTVHGCYVRNESSPKSSDYAVGYPAAEFCYPVTAKVTILEYKAEGYTNASIVVRLTNSGQSPITLPIGPEFIPSGGDQMRRLVFAASLENGTQRLTTIYAYGDADVPSSIATVAPGKSVDYQVPLDLREIATRAPITDGTTIPVVVNVGYGGFEEARERRMVRNERQGANSFEYISHTLRSQKKLMARKLTGVLTAAGAKNSPADLTRVQTTYALWVSWLPL